MSSLRGPILRGGRRVATPDPGLTAVLLTPSMAAPGGRIRGRSVLPRAHVASDAVIRAQAEQAAAALLAEAEQAAAALRAAGRAEAQAIRAAAHAEGLAEGQRAAEARVYEELAQALALVRRVAADSKRLRDSILADAEPQILRLAAAAARRLVGEVVDQHPDLVLRAAQEAIRRAADQRILRIRVHPDSQAIIEARYGPDGADWEIRGDAGLAVGGCIVETQAGIIDASIEGQIGELRGAWEAEASA